MPELPEVETIRRGLQPVLEGRRIARVELRRGGLRWPFPPGLERRLAGARVLALRRRSKYLLADLSSGETLLIHLGMSGRLIVAGRALGRFHHALPAAGPHDHVVLETGDGTRIVLNDARRFGAVDLFPTEAAAGHRLLAGLGPEPLSNDFSAAHLADAFAGRRAPVRALLLDQRVVAGLGNIYVAESLWLAGLSPFRPAGDLGAAALDRLAGAIRAVLEAAIAAGGSTLRDFRHADGALGYFQHEFAVYGRAGAPCRTQGCRGRIERRVVSGRSSFHCPLCQI